MKILSLTLCTILVLVLVFSVNAMLDDEQGWFEDDGTVLSASNPISLPTPPKLNSKDKDFKTQLTSLRKQVKKMEKTLKSQRLALVAALKAAAAAHTSSVDDQQGNQPTSTSPNAKTSIKTPSNTAPTKPATSKFEPKVFHGIGNKMKDLLEKYVNNRSVTEEDRVLEKLNSKKKKGKGFVLQKHVSQQFNGVGGKIASFWNRLRGIDQKTTKGSVLEKKMKQIAKKMAEQRMKFRNQMNVAITKVQEKIAKSSDPKQKAQLQQYLNNLRKYKHNSIEKLKQLTKKRKDAVKKKLRKKFNKKGKKNGKKKQNKKKNDKKQNQKKKSNKDDKKKNTGAKKGNSDKPPKKGKKTKDAKKSKKTEKKQKKKDNKKPSIFSNLRKAIKNKLNQRQKKRKTIVSSSKVQKKHSKLGKQSKPKRTNRLSKLFANLRAKIRGTRNNKSKKQKKNKDSKKKEIGIKQLVNHSKILTKKKNLTPLESQFQQKIKSAVSQIKELKKGSKQAVTKVLDELNAAAKIWVEQIKSQPNTPEGTVLKQKLEDLQKEGQMSKDALEKLKSKL